MNSQMLQSWGFPPGKIITKALNQIKHGIASGKTIGEIQSEMKQVGETPEKFLEDPLWKEVAHGAGRRMSRTKAKEQFTQKQMNEYLAQQNVTLISGGLDESPFAYKDIHEVMEQQSDLVSIVGRFHPRLVKMADD